MGLHCLRVLARVADALWAAPCVLLARPQVLTISAKNVTLPREEWRADVAAPALLLPQVMIVGERGLVTYA